jgi:hypothetical protein
MSQEGEVSMLHKIFNACSSVSNSGHTSAIAKWDFNKSLLIYDMLFCTKCCQILAIAAQ